MATTTVLWTFTASATGMTDSGHSASVNFPIWDSGDSSGVSGDTSGCIQGTCTTKNLNTFEEGFRPSTGETWVTWGLPSTAVVTQLQITAWEYKCAVVTNLTSQSITAHVINSSGTTITTAGELLNAVSLGNSIVGWTAGAAGTARAVDAAYQAATTDVRLLLHWAAVTGSGSTTSVDTRFDTIVLTVTYHNAYSFAASPGSFSVTGQSATIGTGRHIVAAAGSFAVAGQSAGLSHGFHVTASPGSFALAGGAGGFVHGHPFAASPGSFTITGDAAVLSHGFSFTASAGALAVAGQPAAIVHGHPFAGSSGSFTVAGDAAGLSHGFSVTASAGAFTVVGNVAGLVHGHPFAAGAGSFALAGQPADFTHGGGSIARGFAASPGSFAIVGADATLVHGYDFAAAPGSFAVAGGGLSLVHGYNFGAAPGAFLTGGNDADLLHTLAPRIAGVTRDQYGNVLAGCRVILFETATDTKLGETTSDADGHYLFLLAPGTACYAVAFLAATDTQPERCGVTVDTLQAA